MNKLITDQGEEVCGEIKSALNLANFIKNCTKIIVHKNPTLSDEEVNNIKGKITLEEVQRFFFFFLVFWKQLGHFVVRSLSDGFEKSKLLATQKERLTVCIPKGDKPKEYIKILSATQKEGLIVCVFQRG